jgi:hypothetical protein
MYCNISNCRVLNHFVSTYAFQCLYHVQSWRCAGVLCLHTNVNRSCVSVKVNKVHLQLVITNVDPDGNKVKYLKACGNITDIILSHKLCRELSTCALFFLITHYSKNGTCYCELNLPTFDWGYVQTVNLYDLPALDIFCTNRNLREILYSGSGENIAWLYTLTGFTSLVAQAQEVAEMRWYCVAGIRIRIFALTCTVLACMYIREYV